MVASKEAAIFNCQCDQIQNCEGDVKPFIEDQKSLAKMYLNRSLTTQIEKRCKNKPYAADRSMSNKKKINSKIIDRSLKYLTVPNFFCGTIHPKPVPLKSADQVCSGCHHLSISSSNIQPLTK